jgi:hypothetical protein
VGRSCALVRFFAADLGGEGGGKGGAGEGFVLFLFVLVYCNETDTLPLRARVSCCSEYWPLLPPGARGCGTPRLVGCCAVKLDGVDQARVVITDDSLLAVPSRSVRSCFPLTVGVCVLLCRYYRLLSVSWLHFNFDFI